MARQPALWDDDAREPDITGMVHADDPETSRKAATTIARKASALHTQIQDALEAHGPMNDEQLERLPQFADYGPSTIRKRRSELFQWGTLVAVGVAVNSRGHEMTVWALAEARG